MATKRAQAADARREAASGDRADVAAFKFAQHARARKSLACKLDNWRAQRKQADVDRAAAATQAAEDRALDVGGAPTVNSLDALFLGRFGVDASATFARSVRMGRFDVGGDVGASDVLARREASREDV